MRRTNLLTIVALTLLMVFAAPALADETRGAIKSVQPDSQSFVLIDHDLQEHTFQLADNARIMVKDQEGRLTDLKSGESVIVTWEDQGGRRVVTMVRWESP